MISRHRARSDSEAPVPERLRSLHDAEVEITTYDGSYMGTVLSCTRSSVWLISDHDDDVVIAMDEIIRVIPVTAFLTA